VINFQNLNKTAVDQIYRAKGQSHVQAMLKVIEQSGEELKEDMVEEDYPRITCTEMDTTYMLRFDWARFEGIGSQIILRPDTKFAAIQAATVFNLPPSSTDQAIEMGIRPSTFASTLDRNAVHFLSPSHIRLIRTNFRPVSEGNYFGQFR